jgi:hypothetical protein
MPEPIKQKTGSVMVDRQGHTTTEQYGDSVDAQPTKRVKPRDLNLK